MKKEELIDSELSRRTLIKLGGFGAVGLALAGLAGCTPSEPTGNADTSDAPETGGSADPQKTWNPTQTIEADVVVVGAGSGMWAAYTAAKAGLKVIVIEKEQSFNGANTNIIGGTSAAQTQLQKENGVTTTTEQIFTKMMRFGEGSVNSGLVRRCLDGARQVLDTWKELGCELFMGADRYQTGFDSVHVYLTPNKLEMVEQAVIGLGGEFHYNTEGAELIVENGAVIGLYAISNGEEVQYNTKGVILATGGFLSDPEMMKEHFGEQVQPGIFTFATNDGAGLKMATKAGAILDVNYAIGSLADAAGFNSKADNVMGTYLGPDRNQAFGFTTYGCLQVDQTGERFIDEVSVASNPLAFGGAIQTRIGWFYAIVDQKTVDYLTEHSAYDRVGRTSIWPVGALLFDTPSDRLQGDIDKAIAEGWAWKGDTIEALAAAANLPLLPQQLATYNEACAAGHDDWFYTPKEFLISVDQGPFYAVQNQVGALSTMGGVRTDNYTRAVDASDTVIKGLYVGSSDNGSAFNAPYYEVGGTCSAMCLGTSWVAGETAAADIAAA